VGQGERVPEDLALALGLLQRGLHEEAKPYLIRFLDAQPRHARAREAWYRLGTCHQEAGDAAKAIDAFGRSLAGGGGFALRAEARYRMGTLQHAGRDHKAAEQQFSALIAEEAEGHYLQAGARYARGECLRDQGDDRGALQSFLDAFKVAKGEQQGFAFPAAYQAGFASLRLGDPATAADHFALARAAAADATAVGECHYLEGDAALRAGQRPRAAQCFGRAIQGGGAFADDATLGLGFCLVEDGDREGALARFQAVVQRYADSPLVPQARLEVGRLLYQEGRAEPARAELSQLLATRGLDPAIQCAGLELRGLASLDAGATEAAAADFAAALPLASDPATVARVRYGQGEAALEAGNWQVALGHFQAAAGEGADNGLRGDALYGQSLALHKLGRFDVSQKLAEELLNTLPQHRLADLARFAVAENLFAQKAYARADKAYQGVPADHELRDKATFKRGWCAYLAGDKKLAADRFAAMARGGDGGVSDPALAEEALSMAALANLEAERPDPALQAADQYRSRYREGAFLARTERVAARVLRARGDLKGAAARMAVASRAAGDPTEAAADALERAELVYQQGDFEGAQGLYEAVAGRNDSTGARALEGWAWCAFELGDDAKCAELIARGKRHEHIGEARAGLLQLEYALHHRAEKWTEAEAAATAFLRDFDTHERAGEMRYSLGVAQARGGKFAEARKTLTDAAADPKTPRRDRVFYELAWACRSSKDEPAALAAFAQVAKLSEDPDLKGEAELHLGVAALESGSGDAAAISALLSGVQGIYRGRALYRLGFAAFEDKQWRAALQPFLDLVALGESEPLYDEGVHMVGACQFEMGDYAPAAERFAALLKRNDKHPRAQDARLMLGECCVRLDRAAQALAPLGQFLAQAGEAPAVQRARAHLWLGKARQAQNQHEQAEAEFQQVIRLSEGPLGAEAQYRVGEARAARRDFDGAADAFVKLPILYSHEEWVRRGLLQAGLTYTQLEQPAKARRFFEELVSRFPESAEATQAKQRLRTP